MKINLSNNLWKLSTWILLFAFIVFPAVHHSYESYAKHSYQEIQQQKTNRLVSYQRTAKQDNMTRFREGYFLPATEGAIDLLSTAGKIVLVLGQAGDLW